jgi:hypothetical protein
MSAYPPPHPQCTDSAALCSVHCAESCQNSPPPCLDWNNGACMVATWDSWPRPSPQTRPLLIYASANRCSSSKMEEDLKKSIQIALHLKWWFLLQECAANLNLFETPFTFLPYAQRALANLRKQFYAILLNFTRFATACAVCASNLLP